MQAIWTWVKPLINTAWPLTNQTRAYQQDLETNPEGDHSFKVEHRKKKPY